jgi:hypothetical protein
MFFNNVNLASSTVDPQRLLPCSLKQNVAAFAAAEAMKPFEG